MKKIGFVTKEHSGNAIAARQSETDVKDRKNNKSFLEEIDRLVDALCDTLKSASMKYLKLVGNVPHDPAE